MSLLCLEELLYLVNRNSFLLKDWKYSYRLYIMYFIWLICYYIDLWYDQLFNIG